MRRFLKKILKKSPSSNQDGVFFGQLTNILGFKPDSEIYYRHAFTHRSANKLDENGYPISYERLEFLGDAMLGSVIAAHLYKEVPTGDEGYLTKMRSKIVSREHLNELGRDFKLVQFIQSKVNPSHFGDNIHGNLCEAFIGAIYLDKGFPYCEKFIHEKIIKPYVDIERLEGKVISYKSLIIEWCQKEKINFKFEVFEDDGKEGVKHFGVKLLMDNEVISKARATSKKKAEETAAKRAFFALQDRIEKKS
jgi:ribonuclease-3